MVMTGVYHSTIYSVVVLYGNTMVYPGKGKKVKVVDLYSASSWEPHL